jgi:hypothetical protein
VQDITHSLHPAPSRSLPLARRRVTPRVHALARRTYVRPRVYILKKQCTRAWYGAVTLTVVRIGSTHLLSRELASERLYAKSALRREMKPLPRASSDAHGKRQTARKRVVARVTCVRDVRVAFRDILYV